jgi:hypothetical protein
MPLNKGSQNFPTDQRSWDQWSRSVPVTPDPNSVGTIELKDGQVTYTKFQPVDPVSVIGNLHATAQAPGSITAASNNSFLARRSGLLTFDSLADTDIPATIARDTEVSAAVAALQSTLVVTGTYTGAFTGTTTDPAPVIRYSISGRLVALYLPQTSATSNSTTFSITGAPPAIVPTRTQTVVGIVRDNNVVAFGNVTVSSVGATLTLGLGPTTGGFTATGTKGVELQTVVYSLD